MRTLALNLCGDSLTASFARAFIDIHATSAVHITVAKIFTVISPNHWV